MLAGDQKRKNYVAIKEDVGIRDGVLNSDRARQSSLGMRQKCQNQKRVSVYHGVN